MALLYRNLGYIYKDMMIFSKTSLFFDTALSIYKEYYEMDNSFENLLNYVQAIYDKCTGYRLSSELDNALAFSEKGASLLKLSLSKYYNNITYKVELEQVKLYFTIHEGLIYCFKAEKELNMAFARKAIDLFKESLTFCSSKILKGNILNNLCFAYITLARIAINNNDEVLRFYQKALKYGDESLKIREDIEPKGWDTATSLNALGVINQNLALMTQDKALANKAINLFEKALNYRLELYEAKHLSIATIKENLANSLCSIGKFDDAIKIYEEVYKSYLIGYGESHEITICIKKRLEDLRLNKNNFERSLYIKPSNKFYQSEFRNLMFLNRNIRNEIFINKLPQANKTL